MNNSPNTNGHKQNVVCPECDTSLMVPNGPTIGQIIECPACGTQSEFIALQPLTLAPLEEEK